MESCTSITRYLLNNKGTAIILIYKKKKSKVFGVLSLIRNFASRYGIYAELQREIAGADNATANTELYTANPEKRHRKLEKKL